MKVFGIGPALRGSPVTPTSAVSRFRNTTAKQDGSWLRQGIQRREGFGFITPDDGGGDLFAHFLAINMQGFKTLKEGQIVGFEVTTGPKGKQASNIQSA